MYRGCQSFSPFIDVVIHHQFGHHLHLFFFFLTHFQIYLQPSHAVDSEAVYREGCGGWGRHNLVLALSQIEDVDIVSLCAGKEAVFLGKNRLGTFPIPSR